MYAIARPALPEPVVGAPRTGSRRPRPGARVAAATLAATAAVSLAACGAAVQPGDPSQSAWASLRQCESGGNYAADSGNGFYGAYQFSLGTWNGLGFLGQPDQADPAVQDSAALQLWRQSGWSPWPGCSAKLGLT